MAEMAAIENNGLAKDIHVLAIQDDDKEKKAVEDKTADGPENPSPCKDIMQTNRLKSRYSADYSEVMNEESEATIIVDFREIKNTRTCNRLLVIAGELKNNTYLLDRRQLMIGRDKSADLRIPDKSVSKFHALICMKENKCVLKDLNSRNGVIVNGSRIHEMKLLMDADKIEIGSHLFAFIQGDPVKSFRQKIRQNSKTIMLFAAALFCCILMVIGASFFFTRGQDQPVTKSIEKNTSDIKHDRLAKGKQVHTAQVYYNTGDAYIKKKLWEQAIEQYRRALQLDPTLDGIKVAIQQAQFERSCRDIVKKGISLTQKGLHSDAIELIKKIPNHSIYYDDALMGIQAIRNKRHYIVNGTSGTIYSTPSSMSEILSIVAKNKIMTVILSAGQWHKVLSDFGATGWMHRDVLRKNSTISFKKDHPMDRELFIKGVTNEDEGLSLLEKSLRHYIVGRLDLSLKCLGKALQLDLLNTNPIKVNALASKNAIEDIAKRYSTGMQHFKNRKIKQTMGSWEQALATDRKLVGQSESHFSRQIAMYTGDMFYKMAQSAINRGNKEEAKENCSKAFRAQKEHKGCVEIMSSLLKHPKKGH